MLWAALESLVVIYNPLLKVLFLTGLTVMSKCLRCFWCLIRRCFSGRKWIYVTCVLTRVL